MAGTIRAMSVQEVERHVAEFFEADFENRFARPHEVFVAIDIRGRQTRNFAPASLCASPL